MPPLPLLDKLTVAVTFAAEALSFVTLEIVGGVIDAAAMRFMKNTSVSKSLEVPAMVSKDVFPEATVLVTGLPAKALIVKLVLLVKISSPDIVAVFPETIAFL